MGYSPWVAKEWDTTERLNNNQHFIFFYCLIISHHTDRPHFIYPFHQVMRHWDYFHSLAIMDNDAINICIKAFVWVYVFISLVYIDLGIKLMGHMVNLRLPF